jgi:hypothetical protein
MNRFLEMDQNDDASRNLEMGITMITNFVLKKMLINIVFIIMSSKGFVLLQMSDFATLREREREREREGPPSCEETPISEIRGRTKIKSERHHPHHHHESLKREQLRDL